MISTGYKSAYQQGYSDAVRDFRKESKTNVIDKIRTEIEQRPYGVANDNVIQGMKYERKAILEILDKYNTNKEQNNDR